MALTLRHPLWRHKRQHQKLDPLFEKSEIPQRIQTQPKRKRSHIIILGIVILLLILLFA